MGMEWGQGPVEAANGGPEGGDDDHLLHHLRADVDQANQVTGARHWCLGGNALVGSGGESGEPVR